MVHTGEIGGVVTVIDARFIVLWIKILLAEHIGLGGAVLDVAKIHFAALEADAVARVERLVPIVGSVLAFFITVGTDSLATFNAATEHIMAALTVAGRDRIVAAYVAGPQQSLVRRINPRIVTIVFEWNGRSARRAMKCRH